MRIHVLSDLHLEFSPFAPQVTAADVIILAGCGFHAIRPPSPLSSGQAFHGHPAGQSERSDAGVALLVRGALCRQFLHPLSHRIALEVDPISVVHQAVEDGIGQGWIADQFVPVVHGHLAGHEGRALAVAVVQ